MSVTAGSHRLWAHKTYKANRPLQLLLVVGHSLSFQNSVIEWVRDHRLHHKHTDTDADPHNSKRGFFFSHMGWLFTRKTDAVMSKLKTIDMSDLENDPVLMFQYRYFWLVFYPILGMFLWFTPVIFWGESYLVSASVGHLRLMILMHITFLVNSAAHIWGYKPYDKSIGPVENKMVAILSGGEGWHNYHHTFPWDYKTSELGFYRYNFTTALIHFFAWIGWAYDLKSVPKSAVEKRVARTGDGSWRKQDSNGYHIHAENAPWGWDDKDIPQEDKKITQILFSKKTCL